MIKLQLTVTEVNGDVDPVTGPFYVVKLQAVENPEIPETKQYIGSTIELMVQGKRDAQQQLNPGFMFIAQMYPPAEDNYRETVHDNKPIV